jgi:hypothetical protein
MTGINQAVTAIFSERKEVPKQRRALAGKLDPETIGPVLLITALLILLMPMGTSAQSQSGGTPPPSASRPTTQMIIGMKTGDTHLVASTTSHEGKIARWFELQTASISTRYHFIENAGDVTTANNNQYQAVFKGRFKFDPRGHYSINAGVFPGRTFTGGWSDSGWGTGRTRTNLFLKQLYFSAQPVLGLELQYGGLYISHGESTEITSYDYDGYIMGQRVSLTRPRNFFFDEVSITYGSFGDLNRASINKRFHRLKQSNYHQFLVAKYIGERTKVSTDYTFESGVDTLREAVKIHLPELRVIDTFLFENYQRASPDFGYGFGIYGEKKLDPRFTLGGGYAQIDRSMLNSDRFPRGKRLHLNGHLTISPEFSVTVAFTQAVGNTSAALPRTRLDVAFSYNLLHSLRRIGFF